MEHRRKDDTEQQAKIQQFRQMHQDTTDPLARRLMRDIISDLEAQADPAFGSRKEPGG